MRKGLYFIFVLALLSLEGWAEPGQLECVGIKKVKVNDTFWTPRYQLWSRVTAHDVLDKFEGKHLMDAREREENNALNNFKRVAEGQKATGKHVGPPWYDGLVYETIRGIADLLVQYPDARLEQRIDHYIDWIAKAQAADPDGYLDTYTQLVEPEHRWGENGGLLRWQHDVYNAGMLVEAGVHYYEATGKTKLLEVATRFANYMSDIMGNVPKKNIVPAHSGPEEALVKLYRVYKKHPELKGQMKVQVHPEAYYQLAEFWIENRGKHCGYPLWYTWTNPKAEEWIRAAKYQNPEYGDHSRPSWGTYAQDSVPVFEQKTIEGHAVRATLLATGMAAAALENHSLRYLETVSGLWDNMVGKRMFVTGGVGAISYDEKFGPDYFLPTDAYLETCAAVGAGFFSQRMNELTGDGMYMDELERTLYNNVLTGIALSGVRYTYQNPLNAHKHERWEWHGCPCCPPMFLKIVSALPGYIYAQKAKDLYVNLFIGSEAQMLVNRNIVELKQETQYPWKGEVLLTVAPKKETIFTLKVRIPGWAQGYENPFDLYRSNLVAPVQLSVNGKPVEVNIVDGYAEISRKWNKGDRVLLTLPVQPRLVYANESARELRNKVALASGPLVYCLEECDNAGWKNLELDSQCPLQQVYRPELLNGVNVIRAGKWTAIPYYAVGNRSQGGDYMVWIPETENLSNR